MAEENEEKLRKQLKPVVSEEQVYDTLRLSFRDELRVQVVSALDSYDDVNYHVRCEGVDYLFKVHNGVESRDFLKNSADSVIQLQINLMEWLGVAEIATTQPAKAAVLQVCSLPVLASEHSPTKLVTRLLSWVPGKPMSEIQPLAVEALVDSGRWLARMHQAWNGENSKNRKISAAARRYHQWDGKNFSDIKSFVSCIQGGDGNEWKKPLVESVLEAYENELQGVSFRTGLIHGDFNDANILMNQDGKICGVIDFGDSVSSWLVWDVAVAMAYSMLSTYGKAGHSLAAAAAVLRGYHSVFPLSTEERQHLYLLMAVRLATSITLGAYSSQQNPTNEYLLLHAEPAWKALRLLFENRKTTQPHVDILFMQACDAKSTEGVPQGSATTDITFPDPDFVDPLATIRAKKGQKRSHSQK